MNSDEYENKQQELMDALCKIYGKVGMPSDLFVLIKDMINSGRFPEAEETLKRINTVIFSRHI